MTAPWTDAQRRRSIEADLTELRTERRACDDELAVIDRQIDEGLEALHALPTQREAT